MELVADVHPDTALTLRETPLSADQHLEPIPDSEWHRLQANVPDDQETLAWAFGLGRSIKINEPAHWVAHVRRQIFEMQSYYVEANPRSTTC
ncbi:hypothetical protein D3C71_1839190 [compost metagenome]